MIVYGPRPGTEVEFSLDVAPPKEIEDGKGGKIPLPAKLGVDGSMIRVRAKVPNEADKRTLGGLLSRSRIEQSNGQLRVNLPKDALADYQREVIKGHIVRVDDLAIVDPRDNSRFEIHTPEEVLQFADPDVINALVEVVMDRIKLSEALSGNSGGRSTSSMAAIPLFDGTAKSAGSSSSVESVRVTALPIVPTSTSPQSAG